MNVTDLDERIGQHVTDVDPAHDNAVRAGLAVTALKAFAERAGDNEPVETTISDLLADLMHLCDNLGISFPEMVSQAEYHHDPEMRGEF